MSDALLTLITHDTVAASETATRVKDELDFPSIITPVIQAGQRSGIFSTGTEPGEVAAMLTNALLLRSFTRRGESAIEVAGTVADLVLTGVLSRNSKVDSI